MAYQKIFVLGDPTIDRFRYDSNEPRHTDVCGGAYFVKDAIDDLQLRAQVIGYDRPPSFTPNLAHGPLQAGWHNLPATDWNMAPMPPFRAEGSFKADSPSRQFRIRAAPRFGTDFYSSRVPTFLQPANLPSPSHQDSLTIVYDVAIDERTDYVPFQSRTSEFNSWVNVPAQGDTSAERISSLDARPRLIYMINRRLPDPSRGARRPCAFLESLANNRLLRERTVVLLSGDLLRWEGITISKLVSWERTAQDFMQQFYLHPRLRFLHQFDHVVVRFGVTGAIYRMRLAGRHTQRLYFVPTAGKANLFRDVDDDGDILGQQTIFAATIVESLHRLGSENTDPATATSDSQVTQAIDEAVRRSIARCQRAFSLGLSTRPRNTSEENSPTDYDRDATSNIQRLRPAPDVRENFINALRESPRRRTLEHRRVGVVTIPVGCRSWQILNHTAAYNLLDVAFAIVRKGTHRALNNPNYVPNWYPTREPVWAPVVKFLGDSRTMTVVDRGESESYRGVHNLLRNHVREASRPNAKIKPLSIAIFGPPGAGKSSCAKILAESAEVKKEAMIDINVADVPSTGQGLREAIGHALQRLSERRVPQAEDAIPLIFFDEFDCRFEDSDLGCLKYFLPVMEDWDARKYFNGFRSERSPVFIFAGGTSRNYKDFCREDPSISPEERARFAAAKGPDFVSRLRGHINVFGPNPADDYDDSYFVRRAILLRQLLESKLGVPAGRRVSSRWFCNSLVRAMLCVTSYRHGVRSMRAIIDMCVRFGGGHEGRYVSTSLPTVQQLDMHVDAREFLALVEAVETADAMQANIRDSRPNRYLRRRSDRRRENGPA